MLNSGELAMGRKWRGKGISLSGKEISYAVYSEAKYLTVRKEGQ